MYTLASHLAVSQVLQMSVPVDDDSVNDFQLDFRSDQPHYLNLDSISYITKDGNSSTGAY